MEVIDIPKSHGCRIQIREATHAHINVYLPAHISNICVRYIYHPTFPKMDCFRTCGILRMRGIGNIIVWPHLTGFHNARCPEYPDQCVRCGVHIQQNVNTSCSYVHYVYSCLPQSITDHPFIEYDREAAIEYGIQNIPSYMKVGMCFVVSCILANIILKIEHRTGHRWPRTVILTNGMIAYWIVNKFYRWIM